MKAQEARKISQDNDNILYKDRYVFDVIKGFAVCAIQTDGVYKILVSW